MKAEDLFDSIGRVDEDLLARSEHNLQAKAARRRTHIWRVAAIAAAVVLVAAGGIWMAKKGIFRKNTETPGNMTDRNTIAFEENTKKHMMQAVAYPDLPAQPSMTDYADYGESEDAFERYRQDYEKWNATVGKAAAELRSQLYQYGSRKAANAVAHFTEASMLQLLTNRGGENRTYSPVNIYLMLGMLAELTDGNTRDQILKAVESESIEDLRARSKAIWSGLYKNDDHGHCVLGSSVWLRDDTDVYNTNTLERLATEYYAASFRGKMGSDEYNKALQDWLNAMTGGLLKDSVKDVVLDEGTMLALATSLWFTGKWQDMFEPVGNDVFHGANGDTTANYMKDMKNGNYYCGEHFLATMKWFETESNAAMWFVLPDEGFTVDDLLDDPELAQLMEMNGNTAYSQSHEAQVTLKVPKFDVSSDSDLIKTLKAMGITDAFDANKSDFTPMAQGSGYYVSEALHSARVKIDEYGAEAAAYTISAMAGAYIATDKIEITLDRPFLFYIRSHDGIITFIGVVENPENAEEA